MKDNQLIWEIYFLFSLISVVIMLVVGTMENSKEIMPLWPYFFIGAALNVVVAVYIGLKNK